MSSEHAVDKKRLLTGVALIGVQVFIIAYFSRGWGLPVFAVAMLLAGFLLPQPLRNRLSKRRVWLVAGLAVLFLLVRWLAPLNNAMRISVYGGVVDYSTLNALAGFLLCLQVLMFHLRGCGKGRVDVVPGWAPESILSGAAAMGCTLGFVASTMWLHVTALGLAMLYVTLVGLAFSQQHGRDLRPMTGFVNPLLHLLILVVALVVGAGGAGLMYRGAGQMDEWLGLAAQNLGVNQGTGFSGKGGLDSIKRSRLGGLGVALRVNAPVAPGYLRAAAFDRFDGKDWQATGKDVSLTAAPVSEAFHKKVLSPERPSLGGEISLSPSSPRKRGSSAVEGLAPVPLDPRFRGDDEGEGSFEKRPVLDVFLSDIPKNYRPFVLAQGETSSVWTVWSAVQEPGAVFLPQRALWLATAAGELTRTPLGVVKGLKQVSGAPYHVGVGEARQEGNAQAVEQACLALPENLDPGVRALSESVFKDTVDSKEKTAAVVRYFHGNYSYSQDVQIPRGKDPLAWFLLERPAAHCEFFATGATVLLRLAGVPARYVTGFVVETRNPLTGCWTAHNGDAHAWVEAWDETARRWVVVEATPSAGVPGAESASWLRRLTDAVMFAYERVMDALRNPDRLLSLRWLMGLIRRPLAWGVLALLLFWVVAHFSGHRRKKRHAVASIPPEIRVLQALLRGKDRQTRRRGLVRTPQETLHQFADRVEAAPVAAGDAWPVQTACWYRDYALVRYEGPGAREARKRLVEPR